MYYLCFEIRDLQEILGSFVWINTHNTLRSQICAEGDATVLVDPAGYMRLPCQYFFKIQEKVTVHTNAMRFPWFYRRFFRSHLHMRPLMYVLL